MGKSDLLEFRMYGMVNHGIQTFVIENFGEADWRDICARADLKDETFEGMLTYPDDVTYKLVGVLCEKYNLTAEQVLKTFGDYWVDYSATTSVGKLMRFSGQGLAERLDTLNEMHDRIKMSMPHLKPPSFEFEEGEGNEHKLHYASDREGLESMVIGLVEGLGRETGEEVEITMDAKPMYEEFRATFTIKIH